MRREVDQGMKVNFKEKDWLWQKIETEQEEEEFNSFLEKNHTCKIWLDNIRKIESNYLVIETIDPKSPVISGSLIYNQHPSNQKKFELFHFYINHEFLVTLDLNLSILKLTKIDSLKKEMENSENPVEAFLLLIGEIVKNYLYEIDEFEIRLNELLWKIKEKNNIDILEAIHQCRHEILIWKHLMIPVKEILLGIEEAYGEEYLHTIIGRRISKRIKRGFVLLTEYQQEIDTLVDFEDVVSTHRGNEIMKTLTVITTMVTPFSALGAIWGMNFKVMPELNWKYGYLFAVLTILSCSGLLYFYLRMKGWMGDILKGKKKHYFFK
jgi:magnesium transporter